MKQRIIALLLASVMCLLLTACGGETDRLDDYSESPGTETDAGGQEDSAGSEGSGEAASDGSGEAVTDGSGTQSVDGMALGTGMDMGEAVAQLDENPDRAVRRSTKPIVQTVGTMLDGTPHSSDFYLYRNTLNDHGKQVYDLIRGALLEGKATIDMTLGVSPEDAVTVFFMVIYDNPEIFWAQTNLNYSYNNYNCVTSITPVYNELVYDIPGYTEQFENALADALADMWSLGSDAERVKYAHDYLTYTNDYVLNSPYNQSAYSAIVLKDTVCAGYAKAFQYMMHKMGIPCAMVVGDAGGESHGWNIVQIDGEFYAMDVTWDDPVGNPADKYYYNYFNITDNQISQNHTRRDISSGLPWSTGTFYTFQNAFGSYGTDFNAIQGYMPGTDGAEEQPSGGDSDGSGSGDNPYLPGGGDSGSGDNPYLPSGGDDTSGGEWDDFDWDDWSFDDYGELGYDWWNALDEDWTLDDWTGYDDGTWEIWDEETQCYYFYDESDGTFGCMDAYDETFYLLNFETGEWVPLN